MPGRSEELTCPPEVLAADIRRAAMRAEDVGTVHVYLAHHNDA